MMALLPLLLGCREVSAPKSEARPPGPPHPVTEHVRILHAWGSGTIGIGVALDVAQHNLEMFEACAVEASLPEGTCARVRVQVELPRHGGRNAWVSEGAPNVPAFTDCLSRELPHFRFPSKQSAAPASALDIALAVASRGKVDACAQRIEASEGATRR